MWVAMCSRAKTIIKKFCLTLFLNNLRSIYVYDIVKQLQRNKKIVAFKNAKLYFLWLPLFDS